jgi:hypothetical protein
MPCHRKRNKIIIIITAGACTNLAGHRAKQDIAAKLLPCRALYVNM